MDNHWNSRKEGLIKEWRHKCKIAGITHSQASEHYHNSFDRYTVVGIILNGISAILTAIWSNEGGEIIIPIAVAAAISGFSTILGAILKAKNPEAISSKHRETSKEYNKIANDIDTLLAQDRSERGDGKSTLTEYSKKMSQTATGAPVVPKNIWDQTITSLNRDASIIRNSVNTTSEPPAPTSVPTNQPETRVEITENSNDNIELEFEHFTRTFPSSAASLVKEFQLDRWN